MMMSCCEQASMQQSHHRGSEPLAGPAGLANPLFQAGYHPDPQSPAVGLWAAQDNAAFSPHVSNSSSSHGAQHNQREMAVVAQPEQNRFQLPSEALWLGALQSDGPSDANMAAQHAIGKVAHQH